LKATWLQFLFLLVMPLVVVVGGLVTLFAGGAVLDLIDHPEQVKKRIEGLFRRPARPAREPGPHHYYRPHWRS
jgi:hypothetical protein